MERPILFSTAMIQAILEGRKTQTRRVIKPQPSVASDGWITHHKPQIMYPTMESFIRSKCPYNADILWVRETWSLLNGSDNIFCYKADYSQTALDYQKQKGERWNPSIFMPREAARIFLTVKDIRVERLHDISEEDAIAEGMTRHLRSVLGYAAAESEEEFNLTQAKSTFRLLWDSINKKRGYGWDKNPWVWVIEFGI